MPYDSLPNNTNDKVTTWPCSGTTVLKPGDQPLKQSMVVMPTGQVRLTAQPSRCLERISDTSLSFKNCDLNQAQQKWNRVAVPGGPTWWLQQQGTNPRCLQQAGRDMADLTAVACDLTKPADVANLSLAWTVEQAGVHADPRIGHVRNIDTGDCVETLPESSMPNRDGPNGGNNVSYFPWNAPCSGSTQSAQQWVSQRFVQLNNGQLRLADDTRDCLQEGGGPAGAYVWPCGANVGTDNDKWGVDVGTGTAAIRRVVIPSAEVTAAGDPIGALHPVSRGTTAACLYEDSGSTFPNQSSAGSNAPFGTYIVSSGDCSTIASNKRWTFEALDAYWEADKQVRLASAVEPPTAQDATQGSGCMELHPTVSNQWMWMWPCVGTSRASQSFTFTSSGQIKKPQNKTQCLDGWTVALNDVPSYQACSAATQQRWSRVDVPPPSNLAPGTPWPYQQLKTQHTNGNVGCLSGGRDGTLLRIAACNAADAKQWFVVEKAGAVTTARYVKLRNLGSNQCMRPDGTVNDGRSLWAWSCNDTTATDMVFLQTNSGELHPTSNLSFCLDYNATPSAAGVNLLFRACPTLTTNPAAALGGTTPTPANQQWSLDPVTGRLTNANAPGKCAQEIPGTAQVAPFKVGDYSFLTTCLPSTDANAARQRWAFVPVAGP